MFVTYIWTSEVIKYLYEYKVNQTPADSRIQKRPRTKFWLLTVVAIATVVVFLPVYTYTESAKAYDNAIEYHTNLLNNPSYCTVRNISATNDFDAVVTNYELTYYPVGYPTRIFKFKGSCQIYEECYGTAGANITCWKYENGAYWLSPQSLDESYIRLHARLALAIMIIALFIDCLWFKVLLNDVAGYKRSLQKKSEQYQRELKRAHSEGVERKSNGKSADEKNTDGLATGQTTEIEGLATTPSAPPKDLVDRNIPSSGNPVVEHVSQSDNIRHITSDIILAAPVIDSHVNGGERPAYTVLDESNAPEHAVVIESH